MKSRLGIVVLIVVAASVANGCQFDFDVSPDDLSSGSHEKPGFYFTVGGPVKSVRLTLTAPFNQSNWFDVVWVLGDQQGRLSVYDHYELSVEDVDGTATKLSLYFSQGYGERDSIKAFVYLDPVSKSSACSSGRLPIEGPPQETNRIRKQRKRSVKGPDWVSFSENDAADYIWLWPIQSAYGTGTLALAAGIEIGQSHEYVQLNAYEQSRNVLFVPGVGISGPSYPTEIAIMYNYFVDRAIFKYSKRDAAWVLWNFETKKPFWNGDLDSKYWSYRAAGMPATMTGLVFELKQTN